MDIVNELKEEYDHEIRARDHSLRQIGAVVLQLFKELDDQDVKGEQGRMHRSTPLGTLLHDCSPSVENYRIRTEEIERLRVRLREARAHRDGVVRTS